MITKKTRPRPYNRPKNGKGPSNGEQLSSFDTPRHENSKVRSPNGNRNFQQLFDKYNNLAKEALSSGDRVAAEFHFQYADHYLRLINERQNQRPAPSFDKHKKNDFHGERTNQNNENSLENNNLSEENTASSLEFSDENDIKTLEEGMTSSS